MRFQIEKSWFSITSVGLYIVHWTIYCNYVLYTDRLILGFEKLFWSAPKSTEERTKAYFYGPRNNLEFQIISSI